MDPEDWFARLRELLPSPAGAAAPELTDAERDGLLDLARIAAHTSERWTAPLSTFLAGVVLATVPADDRAAAIRAIVDRLESEPPATS